MRPFSLLLKPTGPDCNLDCRYCFYAGKTDLFGGGRHRMSDEVLETCIGDYLSLGFEHNSFAWQGGEPTLMGLDFFKRVVELQRTHGRGGQIVSNALQTNGILLDEQWGEFLRQYKFLVGISLDGPQRFHDRYRRDGRGEGTFERVMAGIEACRRGGVDFNLLVLLNDHNVVAPDELFDFFLTCPTRFWQFVPCVETDPASGAVTDYSISGDEYGRFMCRIFDRWLEYGPEKLSIRLFDSVLAYYVNGRHTNCTFGGRCNDYVVVEHNGDVFCCDFFVTEEWKVGNVTAMPIGELFESETKRRFAQWKRKIAQRCLVCRHSAICRGGCLKDRIVLRGDYDDPSYFCGGYQLFFDHALGRLAEMAAQLRPAGRARGRVFGAKGR